MVYGIPLEDSASDDHEVVEVASLQGEGQGITGQGRRERLTLDAAHNLEEGNI